MLFMITYVYYVELKRVLMYQKIPALSKIWLFFIIFFRSCPEKIPLTTSLITINRRQKER